MKIYLFFVSILMVFGCSDPNSVIEYREGKQLLNMNESSKFGDQISPVKLDIIKPDSIKVKEEAIFKIVISDPDYKLVAGYIDCEISTNSVIDTTTFKVDNCTKRVFVRNDTMFIAFKPKKIGRADFWTDLFGISKGKDGVLRYHSGNFEYYVVE